MSETMGGVVQRLMAQHNEAVARVEQAEKERDEQLSLTQATLVARERAEADNAALLEILREAVDRMGEIETRLPGLVHDKACQSLDENWADECECALASWKRAAVTHHPGAALLERLRELEAQIGHDSPENKALNEIARLFGFGGPGPLSFIASHDEVVEKVRTLLERVRGMEEALGEIATTCEDKILRGGTEDYIDALRSILDKVHAVALAAYKARGG
jgi:hypothetical protein